MNEPAVIDLDLDLDVDLDLDLPTLAMEAGLPGFPDARRFALVQWGVPDSPFSLLRSLDQPDLDFVVAPPEIFFPGYAPEIDGVVADRLGITDAGDALVLVIITLGQRPADATANLLGPVVLNRHTRRAAQVVLEGSGYDTRTPLRPQ